MKKIEMVVPKSQVDDLGRALLEAGADGYSAMDLTAGFGQQMGETLQISWGEGVNAYVFVVCSDESLDTILDAVRPHLRGAGKMAFVSDVLRLFR